MLQLCGEVGYAQASVAAVVARSGSNRARFYTAWEGKAQCYATAYEDAAEELRRRLLASCSDAGDWVTGISRGLLELAAYTDEDPALAAGVIAEVHVAGDGPLGKRDELAADLARAVDRARADIKNERRQPPPATAAFVVAAVEAAVVRSLAEKRSLVDSVPALLWIAVSCYFGAFAADRAVRRLARTK